MRAARIGCLALGLAFGLAERSNAQEPPPERLSNGPYLELQGGWSVFPSSHLEIESAAVTGDGRADYDSSGTYGGALGFRVFHLLRLEAHASYRSMGLSQVRAAGFDIGHHDGHADAATFLGNAYLDFPVVLGPFPLIAPFVGGGAGVAIYSVRIDDNQLDVDGDDTVLAWNVMGGVLVPVGRHLELDVRYRYLAGDDAEVDADVLGTDGNVEAGFEAHETVVALRVVF
jgi:opacity protein-like surface antigen